MTAVYTRDASWHNRPDVRTPKKYHRANRDLMPACGNVSMLNDESKREHTDVLASLLCGRCFPRSVGKRTTSAVGGAGQYPEHDHTGMGS